MAAERTSTNQWTTLTPALGPGKQIKKWRPGEEGGDSGAAAYTQHRALLDFASLERASGTSNLDGEPTYGLTQSSFCICTKTIEIAFYAYSTTKRLVVLSHLYHHSKFGRHIASTSVSFFAGPRFANPRIFAFRFFCFQCSSLRADHQQDAILLAILPRLGVLHLSQDTLPAFFNQGKKAWSRCIRSSATKSW